MFRFIIYHGNLDDFDRGPKRLKVGYKTDSIARYAIIDQFGIEVIKARPREPFYTTLLSFDWRRRKYQP